MNTPAIRVVGPSGSGRSAIAAALHKLLMDSGVTSEVISCTVDEQSWRLELKHLLRGKLLPIIVSPNRPGDDIPPTMDLMKELASARKSAQDMHKKCQKLEAQVAETEQRLQNVTKDSEAYDAGFSAGCREAEEKQAHICAEMQREFDRKMATYKDAIRSELKALRHGGCPDAFIASHTYATGKKSTPYILLSYHRPSADEVREACGYPSEGEVACDPLIVPLIPPRIKP